ncbi:hypothetical protein LguiA_030002 [Lonicera macranthoides]
MKLLSQQFQLRSSSTITILKHAKGTSKSFNGGTRSLDRGKILSKVGVSFNFYQSSEVTKDSDADNNDWKGDSLYKPKVLPIAETEDSVLGLLYDVLQKEFIATLDSVILTTKLKEKYVYQEMMLAAIPPSSKETDLLHRSTKRVKEITGLSTMEDVSVCRGELASAAKHLSFADTVRKNGSEVQKGVTFQGVAHLDMDKIAVTPPSPSSPYPSISLHPDDCSTLEAPWPKATLVKLLGKTLSYSMILNRLMAMWKPGGESSLMELGYGFYLFKCEDEDTIDRALSEGPWIISGNYVAVQKWKPGFCASKGSISSTCVWVRIPELPVELYS